MRCPRDQAELTPQIYEANVEVDFCPSCQGMWLDKGELETIQETIENDYSDTLYDIGSAARAYEMARQKALPNITCPSCQAPLIPKQYGYCSQILIDVCPQCEGVWLDKGEIQALEQFFERERPDVVARAKPADVRRGFLKSLVKLFGG
jgi:Zn-finger nucleic acid-binding protein